MFISQLCRICGEASDDLIECFGDKGKEMLLVEKIHTYLPIKVTEDDLLPINVCTSCIEKLEMCHDLVEKCFDADGKLRKLLGFESTGYEVIH
ncbi:hypothetical protein C0J52_27030 [Blattella germanica]|nr:hypothetical protein C0J52_27030 [Blattella germanica]